MVGKIPWLSLPETKPNRPLKKRPKAQTFNFQGFMLVLGKVNRNSIDDPWILFGGFCKDHLMIRKI